MKNSRHMKILELIGENHIETQEELAHALKQAGFDVTQATVSRDIRELKLTKLSGGEGRQYYGLPQDSSGQPDSKYIRVLKDGFLNARSAKNILVVMTVPGMAMAVAAAVDALGFSEIIGSIAGDDTIFCATESDEDAMKLAEKLQKLAAGNS